MTAPPPDIDLTRRRLVAAAGALILPGWPAMAAAEVAAAPTAAAFSARQLPARVLPVPTTVSPQLAALIAAPYPPGWDEVPTDAAGWSAMAAASAAAVAPHLPAIRQRFELTVAAREIGGAKVYEITPRTLPEANRNRLLLHLHGGGYVLYPGEAGAGEGMLMAGFGGFRVVSVDYRMAPDFPFPAALDDAVAVWRALVAETEPRRMAVFGSSAGGGLTLSLMLRAQALGLPLPAAIAPGTPWSDLTGAGDSLMANAYVDNVLVANTGWAGAAAGLYAAGHELADPLLSPIFGDFTGLPPAIITSGTRDLFLSHAVRAHRKLRLSGVEAALNVFEGQSHAQFLDPSLPECAEAFAEIAGFLGQRLAR